MGEGKDWWGGGGGGGEMEVRRKIEKEENNEFVRAEMNPTPHLDFATK